MSKDKLPKSKVKLPKYEAYLSFQDLTEIDNYITSSTDRVITQDGVIAIHKERGDIDIALFGLRKGLRKVGDVEITEDNFEEVLRKHCDQNEIVLLYNDMWRNALKKK